MSEFSIGDRVIAKEAVREQALTFGPKDWPGYGHVVNPDGQGLVWVKDHLGGEWGLPASELEHID